MIISHTPIYYSKVDAKYFFLLAVPTVHTNANNEITSVSIEYKSPAGEIVNPENFVYQTMIQLGSVNFYQICQVGALWENPEAKTNNELYNFVPPNPVQISELRTIVVSYLDLVGNSYSITFIRE